MGKNMSLSKLPKPGACGIPSRREYLLPLDCGRVSSMASGLNVPTGVRKNNVLDPIQYRPFDLSYFVYVRSAQASCAPLGHHLAEQLTPFLVASSPRLVSGMDRLGYDRPNKAVDWLINKAKNAIAKLDELLE
ncbi:hypothetical protein RJ639_001894 [Escallonia herrerae]|uniref:TCP domain-containing protein n=1 Tax=Escallonia herrerae TaxID=1293975 RepID=A0AA89BFW4_9ASTE|nr:hypothetical protein RJ639_001894 [Escallonia herrerae]